MTNSKYIKAPVFTNTHYSENIHYITFLITNNDDDDFTCLATED